MGNDAFSRSLQQKVSERLRASNHYVVTPGSDDADTAITGLARMEGKRKDERTGQEIEVGHVALQFVNVSGDVIWRTKRLRGTADEIAVQFMSDLLGAIENEKRRQ